MNISKDKAITFCVFLLIFALIGLFIYGTIGWNFLVSITDWEGLTPSYNIVGFKQYQKLFNNPVFWQSLKNQIKLIILFVPTTLLIGLGMAILLDQKIKAENQFRTLYLLPFALSFVVTATFWAWLYNPESGAINVILEKLNLGFLTSGWVTDPSIVLYSIVLALIWQFSGYTMLILLAGVKSIPESQISAAKIDGASAFDLYGRVVIPQLKGPILSAFVVLMVFALKAFDFIWVLTRGGPGYSSYVLAVEMYKTSFGMTKFALGAAVASILFILVMLIVVPYLYLTYEKKEEGIIGGLLERVRRRAG